MKMNSEEHALLVKRLSGPGGCISRIQANQEVPVPVDCHWEYQGCESAVIDFIITANSIWYQRSAASPRERLLKLRCPLNYDELIHFNCYCFSQCQKFQPYTPPRYYEDPELIYIEWSQLKRMLPTLKTEKDKEIKEMEALKAELKGIWTQEWDEENGRYYYHQNGGNIQFESPFEQRAERKAARKEARKAELLAEQRAERKAARKEARKAELLAEQAEKVWMQGWDEKIGRYYYQNGGNIQFESPFGNDEELRQEQYAERLTPTEEAMKKVAEYMKSM